MADGGKVIIKIDGDTAGFDSKVSKIGGIAKKSLGITAKAVAAGMAAAGAAIGAIGVQAVKTYGEYEQLVGGVETLFKDSADKVVSNAANAFKTAGLSANKYMDTVTSFSASLLQSLGNDTEKATAMADMAVTDMSDNANKMGTDINMIVQTYQSLARGNFAMLDNLKLGYGGTRAELERLLKDAEDIKRANGEMASYSIDSFADIVDAIHVVQTNMGITGTTAKEASTTIQGSFNAMRSAWENLMTGLTDPSQDIDRLIDDFFDTFGTFIDNLIPRLENVLSGIGKVIAKLAPKLLTTLTNAIGKVLPSMIKGAQELLNAFVRVISSNASKIGATAANLGITLVKGILSAVPQLAKAGYEVVHAFIQGITGQYPALSAAAQGILMIFAAIKIGSVIQKAVQGFQMAQVQIALFTMSTQGATIAQGALTGALTIGQTAVALLTGQITIAELATALWTKTVAALNAVMMANPILLVVAAVAAVVGGIYLAINAYDAYLESNSEMIKGVNALGEATDQVIESNKQAIDSFNSLKDTYMDSAADAGAEAYANQKLADELFNLAGQTDLTAAEKQRMQLIVDELNKSVDGLNLAFDSETGQLNMTAEAVSQLIEKKKQLAEAEAALEFYKDSLKSQYSLQAQAAASAKQLADIESQYNDIRSQGTEVGVRYGASVVKTTQYTAEQSKAMKELKEQEEELKKSQSELNDKLNEASTQTSYAEQLMNQYGDATEKAGQQAVQTADKIGNEAPKAMEAAANSTKVDLTPGFVDPVEQAANDAKQVAGQGGTDTGEAFNKGVESADSNAPQESFAEPVQEASSTAVKAANQGGTETGQAYANGITSRIGAVRTAATAYYAAVSLALAKATSAARGLGANFGQGYANGIKSKIGAVRSAATWLGLVAKAALALAQDSHSPAKETIKLGRYFGEGYEIGMESAEVDIWKQGIKLGKRALEGLMTGMNSLKSKAVGTLEALISDNRTEVQKAFDEMNEVVLESEKKYEDEYERLKDSQSEADKKYLEDLKETAEKERKLYDALQKDIENNKKTVIDTYSEMVEAAFDAVDEIEKAQNSMRDKMRDSTKLFETQKVKIAGQEYESIRLSDINKQNEALREYLDMMQAVKERGNIPKEFLEEMRDMSVEDGTKFAKAILSLDDSEFNAYLEAFKENRKLTEEGAKEIYDDEAKAAQDSIIKSFDAFNAELEEQGQLNANAWGDGFLEKLREVVPQIMDSISNSFAGIISSEGGYALAGVGGNTYQNVYYIQPSEGESTYAQIKALKDAETLKNMRGGY